MLRSKLPLLLFLLALAACSRAPEKKAAAPSQPEKQQVELVKATYPVSDFMMAEDGDAGTLVEEIRANLAEDFDFTAEGSYLKFTPNMLEVMAPKQVQDKIASIMAAKRGR